MSKIKFDLTNTNFTDSPISRFECEQETQCPICKAKISPPRIASMSYDRSNKVCVCILNFCTSCHSPFISEYIATPSALNSTFYLALNHIGSEPNRFFKEVFDEKISAISPQFDKIYNQALAAEISGLDEIAGLGYRKALEFLIKDFAIHEHPDDESRIKAMSLSTCINNYIDAPNIKTLATRSAWIGNDEAHYIRKQEDRDINDMKNFIKATVYFIGMILIVEDAASMEPK